MLATKMKKNTFCRLCLQSSFDLLNIFDNNNTDEINNISKEIYRFFSVEIARNDPYSTCICRQCFTTVFNMRQLRFRVCKNDAQLQKKNPRTQKEEIDDLNYCHDSVLNLFKQNQNLKIDIRLWKINFNVRVDLSRNKISTVNVDKVINSCSASDGNYGINCYSDMDSLSQDKNRQKSLISNTKLKHVHSEAQRPKRVHKRPNCFGNSIYFADDDPHNLNLIL